MTAITPASAILPLPPFPSNGSTPASVATEVKETCFFWYHEGNCRRGEDCKFEHEARISWPIHPPPGYVHWQSCYLPLCPLRQDVVERDERFERERVLKALAISQVDRSELSKHRRSVVEGMGGEDGESDVSEEVLEISSTSASADIVSISSDSDSETDSDGSSPSDSSSSNALSISYPLPRPLPSNNINASDDDEPRILYISHANADSRRYKNRKPPTNNGSCSSNHHQQQQQQQNNKHPTPKFINPTTLISAIHELAQGPTGNLHPSPFHTPIHTPTAVSLNPPRAQKDSPDICFYWYHKGTCRPKRGLDGHSPKCIFLHTLQGRSQRVSLPRFITDHNPECPLELCPARRGMARYGPNGKGRKVYGGKNGRVVTDMLRSGTNSRPNGVIKYEKEEEEKGPRDSGYGARGERNGNRSGTVGPEYDRQSRHQAPSPPYSRVPVLKQEEVQLTPDEKCRMFYRTQKEQLSGQVKVKVEDGEGHKHQHQPKVKTKQGRQQNQYQQQQQRGNYNKRKRNHGTTYYGSGNFKKPCRYMQQQPKGPSKKFRRGANQPAKYRHISENVGVDTPNHTKFLPPGIKGEGDGVPGLELPQQGTDIQQEIPREVESVRIKEEEDLAPAIVVKDERFVTPKPDVLVDSGLPEAKSPVVPDPGSILVEYYLPDGEDRIEWDTDFLRRAFGEIE